MEVWAVIVAGGAGSRFGSLKQFAHLAGRPIVAHSLETARKVCAGVVLVVPDPANAAFDADHTVAGGATRSESVRRGLAAVPSSAGVIAVHDAARPLATLRLWEAVLEAVEGGADGAIPAVRVTDTVKEVTEDGRLVTLDRSRLVAVQTPQAFNAEVLRSAYRAGSDATDDASLVEAAGGKITLVDGSPHNIKITTPSDLLIAEALVVGQ